MPKFSIIAGIILIIIGVAGYYVGVTTGHPSYTALIPAAIGVIMAALGAIALAKEGLRMHMMHAAVVVALLGFIATSVKLLPSLGTFSGTPAQLSQLSTAIVCLAFVIFAIRSFIAARNERA